MSAKSTTRLWAEQPEIDYKPARGPYRILVADDDASLVNLLKENFQYLGYLVDCAYDGQEALQKARDIRPDLIILDVQMPMTNGIKAFQYLRESPLTSRIPVIFVTAELSDTVYPVVALAQRVAHIKKPIDLESFNS